MCTSSASKPNFAVIKTSITLGMFTKSKRHKPKTNKKTFSISIGFFKEKITAASIIELTSPVQEEATTKIVPLTKIIFPLNGKPRYDALIKATKFSKKDNKKFY